MSLPRTKPHIATILLTAIISAAIFAPIVWRLAATGYDYQVHMGIAANMLKTGAINTPHFLLQAGAILLSPLTGGIFNATVVLVLLAEAMTAVIVFRYILPGKEPSRLALPMTLALLLAAPVAILFPLDRHLYLGYIGINLFHNPTMFLLKPLALLSFAYTVKSLESDTRLPGIALVISAILTVVAAVAKPSYTIVILPALAIFLSGMIILKRRFDWKFHLFSIFIPAVVILLLQYRMTYSAEQVQGVYSGTSGIIFAPLAVMSSYSAFLLPKLLLSLLFPLAVFCSNYREAARDTGIQLGWLLFGIGCFYTYFLAESGPRMLQGNFSWSAQVSLFILFAASAKLFLNLSERAGKAKVFFCGAALVLHASFGIAFYIAEFVRTELYW
jgi:hypothetical protein